jgi:hypothetical protein
LEIYSFKFQQLFIEVLCHGSLTEEEANGICSIIKENLKGTALPIKSRYAAERIMCLPSKANIVLSSRSSSEIDTNSEAEVILVELVVIFIPFINAFLNIREFTSIVSNNFISPHVLFFYLAIFSNWKSRIEISQVAGFA